MKKLLKISLDQFVSKIYLPYCKAVKRSWQVDERVARQYLSPTFGETNLCEIRDVQVAEWFYALSKKGLAPVTCNRILAVFRALCGHARRLGFIKARQDLFANVKSHRIRLQKRRILSVDEARRLMRNLKKEKNPAAYALRLLMLTGARKNEILKARWDEIDLERRILTVPISKSGKSREIVLSSEALLVINEIGRIGSSPWLFPGRGDKHLSDIYVFWNRIRERVGLRGMRIHDLRHSFASFLVNAGNSLFEAQTLLGHSNPRATMRYASLGNSALLKAVESINRVFRPEPRNGLFSRLFRGLRRLFAQPECMETNE